MKTAGMPLIRAWALGALVTALSKVEGPNRSTRNRILFGNYSAEANAPASP